MLKKVPILLTIAVMVLASTCKIGAAADNPTQVIASASGDTEILPAVAGKRYRIHAMAVIATSTTSVAFYLHNDDNDLFGDSSNTITIDADGIDGPAGMILPDTKYGWFTTDVANEAVDINLSAASRPVVVLIVYTLF